ncbi:MAG: DUF2027 domain-containing protein, partial [Prevotella sp.]|nr:DUF2027 domain-containing protein [Prevotella sp.]
MKIGDKVRFLSTTGGGIVKGFQSKDIVLVEDEEGFDIPVLIREIVVIEPTNDMQVRQSTKPVVNVDTTPKPIIKEEEYKPEETKEGNQLTVLLSYLPVDIKNLGFTNFECYLINDSNYYLSYNYMSRTDSGWISRNAGTIEPNTKLFLEEFEKAELNDIERVCLQFFAYKKEKTFSIKNTYSVEVHLDTVKFYKLHSFKENDYFEDSAILYPLVRKDLAEKELVISPEEIEAAMKQKGDSQRPRVQHIEKKEKNAILEIDLHIDELLDNTTGLSNGDILEYQIKKFKEIMDENKQHKGKKIVFIHG